MVRFSYSCQCRQRRPQLGTLRSSISSTPASKPHTCSYNGSYIYNGNYNGSCAVIVAIAPFSPSPRPRAFIFRVPRPLQSPRHHPLPWLAEAADCRVVTTLCFCHANGTAVAVRSATRCSSAGHSAADSPSQETLLTRGSRRPLSKSASLLTTGFIAERRKMHRQRHRGCQRKRRCPA